jgi:hypothetical protein
LGNTPAPLESERMPPLNPEHAWPGPFDTVVTGTFLALVLGICATGYVLMALDVRAYLRSLRRGLAVVSRFIPGYDVPDWARNHTPRAVAAFGLRMPCDEEELKRAYRARVKRLHPDHGGDQRRFLRLQADFEEALSLVREAAAVA